MMFVAGGCGLAGDVMAETDVILTPDQRVRVFISSTLEELAAERVAARRAIQRLHLVPVYYEPGARPPPPPPRRAACTGHPSSRARCLSASIGSGTAGSAPVRTSPASRTSTARQPAN